MHNHPEGPFHSTVAPAWDGRGAAPTARKRHRPPGVRLAPYAGPVTPLQKIAMGLVIVLVPADFPRHPHPAWAVYDALPDPIGWALVLVGVYALAAASDIDLDAVRWTGILAFIVSIPLWFPQVNHLLVPKYNSDITVSGQWAISLPQTLFSLILARQIGRAGIFTEPRDTYIAGRFGVLTWGFGALLILPAIAYGGDIAGMQHPTLLLIGLVNIAFIYYLFMANRRTFLGGPGPRDWGAEVKRLREESESRRSGDA
jgi:hypothetical protein